MTEFLRLDLVPLLSAVFACLACGLLGNLLLLTRQSLLGDAISHAVLPGLVLGFWV
ncbi:MAG: metal ABC transporter permease, partial [Elioraea sp.]|nr:metal ABC transporter permease [Elioraea sp.]